MKKIVALMLAALMLCSCVAALAEVPPVPSKSSFASMETLTKNGTINISLSKPVDKLFVNWPNELKVVELALTEDMKASVAIGGQNTQPGLVKTVTLLNNVGEPFERLVATDLDRAFITLQGGWFVCYNRVGKIVDVVYAGETYDIQAVRDLAFQQVGENVFDGLGMVTVVKGKHIIVPADF